MVLHLLQQLLLDARLIFSQALLDCVLLLLELLNIVHDNLGPVIILLLGGGKAPRGLLEDLGTGIFDGGRTATHRGLREGFISRELGFSTRDKAVGSSRILCLIITST